MSAERRSAGSPEHLVIAALENDLARVKWGRQALDLPRNWLPKGAHLSIHLDGDGRVKFAVDAAATRQARARGQATLDHLNAEDQGGDIQL